MEPNQKNKAGEFLPWVLVAIMIAIIAIQYFSKPEPDNTKELEYKATIAQMEARDKRRVDLIVSLKGKQDSLLVLVKTKPQIDKNLIHIKHEKNRDDFRLLAKSDRVDVFRERFTAR